MIAEQPSLLRMKVQIFNNPWWAPIDVEFLIAPGNRLKVACAHDFLRISVWRKVHLLALRMARLEIWWQPRGCDCDSVTHQIGGEVALYNSSVLKGNLIGDDYGRAVLAAWHDSKSRSEQEKRNAPLWVELDDVHEYAERRIVDHHPVLRIFGVLIVSAWVERPQHHLASHVVYLSHILQDRIVYVRRRVCVIRRFWAIPELCNVRLVIVEHYRVAASACRPLNWQRGFHRVRVK